MAAANVAEQLLELFIKNGIDKIYGVTGDAVFPFFDVLGQNNKIKYIGTTHEVNAAFMASYQAKLTGKIGVCVATSGPGVANLINGLADAYFDKAPVLVITGQVGLKKIGTGAKQYINQQSLLQAVTSSSELVTSSEKVIPVVARALERAVNMKTVTHVSIPVDLFSQSSGSSSIPIVETRALARWGSGYASRLEEAIPMLQNAQRPLIVVGKSDKELHKSIIKLAEVLGAGIIVAQQAKGVIPDNHPRVIGGIGQANVPQILQEVDCILEIGTASYEKSFLPTGLKTVQIESNPERIDYQKTSIAVTGNIIEIIKLFVERINVIDNKFWQDKLVQEKDILNKMVNEQKENKANPIQPAHLMAVLSDIIPSDAIIVCDIGGFIHWFDTYFQAREQTVLISSHWRSMGSGLPGALSAALNQAEKKVIALVGDGGFLMSLNELATIVKYNIPVTIIVTNNHLYELEKQRMEYQGLKPFGVDLSVPNFTVLANSFGIKGERVTDAEELEPIINESINLDEPVVIDVQLAQVQLPFIK